MGFEVEEAIAASGITQLSAPTPDTPPKTASQITIAIDYSKANACAACFYGRSLHALAPRDIIDPNPYQMALFCIIKTLSNYDADDRIPLRSFGAKCCSPDGTPGSSLMQGQECQGWEEVLQRYGDTTPSLEPEGAVGNFGPLLHQCARGVMATGREMLHIVVVLSTSLDDGAQEDCTVARQEITEAILKASELP